MPTIKEYSPIEAGLAELKNKYDTVHDMTTANGYDQCKSDARAVGKYRTSLETVRKEIKEPALQRCRDIDSEAKRIQIEIFNVENPLKLAYKAIDDEKKKKEAERLAKIEAKIEGIRDFIPQSIGADSENISVFIELVENIDCTEGFYELTKEALIARKETLEHLGGALGQAIQNESAEEARKAQEIELQELRKIKEEQDQVRLQMEKEKREIEHQKELQEQTAKAAKRAIIEEERTLEAARQAKINAEKAEIKRLADVKQAQEEATQREVERQSAEKKAEQERLAKLESCEKHVIAVRCEIKKHIMKASGIDEVTAIKVVKSLLKTARITVNY